MTIYTVQDGDTLGDLAVMCFGKASRWPELYKLNRETIHAEIKRRGGDPSARRQPWEMGRESDPSDWIFIGQTLRLP